MTDNAIAPIADEDVRSAAALKFAVARQSRRETGAMRDWVEDAKLFWSNVTAVFADIAGDSRSGTVQIDAVPGLWLPVMNRMIPSVGDYVLCARTASGYAVLGPTPDEGGKFKIYDANGNVIFAVDPSVPSITMGVALPTPDLIVSNSYNIAPATQLNALGLTVPQQRQDIAYASLINPRVEGGFRFDEQFVHWVDHFTSGNASNGSIGDVGWCITGQTNVSRQPPQVDHPGIFRVQSTGTSGDKGVLTPGGGTATGSFPITSDIDVSFVITPNPGFLTSGAANYRIGLADDMGVASPSNCVWLECMAGETSWYAMVVQSGVQRFRLPLTTFNENNWNWLRIRTTPTKAAFTYMASITGGYFDWLPWQIVQTVPTWVSSSLPGQEPNVQPGIQVHTTNNNAKRVDVDYVQILCRPAGYNWPGRHDPNQANDGLTW